MTTLIVFGPFTLDLNRKTIAIPARIDPVSLTWMEVQVLHAIVTRNGQPASKDDLRTAIYPPGVTQYDRLSNTTEVFVSRLRRKLDPHGNLQPILTRRLKGYALNPRYRKEIDYARTSCVSPPVP